VVQLRFNLPGLDASHKYELEVIGTLSLASR
jgi:hypothetical protein